MLHIGTNYLGRAFRAQRNVAATPVGKLVHLLSDHVGGVSRAAAEYLRVLEAWAHYKAEAELSREPGKTPHELTPARAFGSENVLGPLGGLKAGHRPAGARAPLLPGMRRYAS